MKKLFEFSEISKKKYEIRQRHYQKTVSFLYEDRLLILKYNLAAIIWQAFTHEGNVQFYFLIQLS